MPSISFPSPHLGRRAGDEGLSLNRSRFNATRNLAQVTSTEHGQHEISPVSILDPIQVPTDEINVSRFNE